MTTKFETPILITDRCLLIVSGPDARTFLQGQVTCDISALDHNAPSGNTCLGAHCTPKGRMLFSFRAFALADDVIALAIYRPMLDQALAALKKYSVFSKVELTKDDRYSLVGLHKAQVSKLSALFPETPDQPDQAQQQNENVLIRLSDNYYESWLTQEALDTIHLANNGHSGNDYWNALAIELGIAEVRPETVEAFIPQMLNFQSIGNAISFKKGCYTGQEVVARMHYLGKLKRHLYRFDQTLKTNLKPGDSLYTPTSQQAIGHIALSSALDNTLLAVVTAEAVEQDQVFTDQECTHKLEALSLPYAITKGV